MALEAFLQSKKENPTTPKLILTNKLFTDESRQACASFPFTLVNFNYSNKICMYSCLFITDLTPVVLNMFLLEKQGVVNRS